MNPLPDRIYIIDPYDENGDLLENTEDVLWCADPVGDVNVAFIAEQVVANTLADMRKEFTGFNPSSEYTLGVFYACKEIEVALGLPPLSPQPT